MKELIQQITITLCFFAIIFVLIICIEVRNDVKTTCILNSEESIDECVKNALDTSNSEDSEALYYIKCMKKVEGLSCK